MKHLFALVLIFGLIFVTMITSSAAIKIDGAEHYYEWESAECIELISGADSNNVEFSLIKCCFDTNGYDAYFMLYLTDGLSENLNKCGFILTLNDGVEITVTSDKITADCNLNLHNISARMNIVESDGVYCEIKVLFKKGIPDTVSGTVSYIDGSGNNSYYYPFGFDYKDVSDVDITEKSTVRPTEKTTTVKTTNPKTEAKPETTKQILTEKVKTTSKRNENKTVVYFYEKEVFVSQVFVSDTSPLVVNNTVEESTTAPVLTAPTQRNFQTADGIAVQKIICAVGGVILVAFAAWAGLSAKKKPTENKGSDSNETDNQNNADKK